MAVDTGHPDPETQLDLENAIRTARPGLIDYARAWTDDQTLNLRVETLKAAGALL